MKRFIFVILIVIPSFTNAQSESLHFGFKLEFYGYTLQNIVDLNYNQKFYLTPEPSMYILLMKDFSESTSIIFKPGVLVKPREFRGLELGLYIEYRIPNNFFLNGGFNFHFPYGSIQGTQFYEQTNSLPPVSFILFGIGYYINEVYRIDIAYHHALNPEFGFTTFSNPPTIFKKVPLELNNMLKIGLSLFP